MKYLVTGATGFVGSSLVRTLAKSGAEIFALARPSSSPDRLADVPLTWIVADVTQSATLDGILADIDYVIHAAGQLGKAGTTEKEYMQLHVEGTRNLLNEVSKYNPQPRTLYVSSPGVLGPIQGEAADENAPLAPSNPYERSKAVAERMVAVYAAGGLPVVIARPEFIYGPGDSHVLGMFEAIQQGRFFYIGDGNNTCHPTYIDDATDGMLRCLEQGQPGEIYHITGPRPVTFRELAETIANALGVPQPRFRVPRTIAMTGAAAFEALGKLTRKPPPLSRTGVAFFSEDRRFSWVKAKNDLNYRPKVDLQLGIEATVAWYCENGYL